MNDPREENGPNGPPKEARMYRASQSKSNGKKEEMTLRPIAVRNLPIWEIPQENVGQCDI